MSQPVLVRGSLAQWPFMLLTIVGFVVLAVAAAAGVAQYTVLAVVLGIVGVVALALVPILRKRQQHHRMWAQDTGTGFKITDNIGDREFRDDQVLSTALLCKNNFSNGVFKSQTRTFRIWVSSPEPRPELVEMKNTMKIGEADPLDKMIQRLNNRLYEQAKQDHAAGHSVLGEHWSLQGKKLTLRERHVSHDCTLDDLTAIDVLEDHVSFWRQSQDNAFARVPVTSANAILLHRLVDDHLAARPKATVKPPEAGQLGRILFERKPKTFVPGLWLVLGNVCLVCGIALTVGLAMLGVEVIIGLGFLGGGAMFLFLHFYYKRMLFRCHEFGVYQKGLFQGERSLRYDDVQSFTYSATRHYHNGAYVGTNIAMTFEPAPALKSQRIAYSASVQNQDDALEELRDQISRMIAARMAAQTAKGEVVPWTANMTFRTEGIEYRPDGFLGSRKEPMIIPYSSIVDWKLDGGYFYLWQAGKQKPTITETADQANFFPGFFMLDLLFHTAAEGAPREVQVEMPTQE